MCANWKTYRLATERNEQNELKKRSISSIVFGRNNRANCAQWSEIIAKFSEIDNGTLVLLFLTAGFCFMSVDSMCTKIMTDISFSFSLSRCVWMCVSWVVWFSPISSVIFFLVSHSSRIIDAIEYNEIESNRIENNFCYKASESIRFWNQFMCFILLEFDSVSL